MPTAPSCIEPPDYPSRPDLAVAALLYLLTRFITRPCGNKADAILHHLMLVAADQRNSSELRQAAHRLSLEWRQRLAASDQPDRAFIH